MARNPSEILEPSYKLRNECGARPDLGGPLEYDRRLGENCHCIAIYKDAYITMSATSAKDSNDVLFSS